MEQELYLIICETQNKKHIKRIFKTSDDCHQYLQKLHDEVTNDAHELYSLISYLDEELIIEELTETEFGVNVQRKYSILSGNVDEVLSLMMELIHEKSDTLF